MSLSQDEIDICEKAISLCTLNKEAYEKFTKRLSYGALLRLEAIMTKYENTLEESR